MDGDGDTSNTDAGGDFIGTAGTTLEEQVLQQNKLEASLKEEVMSLHQYCEKRVEEIAQLRKTKWELEEKLQVLNIQNDLMNTELENENKQVEAEVEELTKLEQTIWEEKNKQIKNVEEYERQINNLFQQLDCLPSLYDKEQICSDIQSFKERTEVNRQKLKALAEDTQLYKYKYEALESGEEAKLVHILGSIRAELEETAREINLENEQNEKMLQNMRNEAMQLKQDIAKLQKLSS